MTVGGTEVPAEGGIEGPTSACGVRAAPGVLARGIGVLALVGPGVRILELLGVLALAGPGVEILGSWEIVVWLTRSKLVAVEETEMALMGMSIATEGTATARLDIRDEPRICQSEEIAR